MIESKVKKRKAKQEKKFPKLMKSKSCKLVVLFQKSKNGFTVFADGTNLNKYPMIHYREDWDMDQFKDFDGKIILKNK